MAAKLPQGTVSCLSGTTKGRSPSGGFALALWKPLPDRSSNYAVFQREQVAAALSAAVTTTKPIGDAPTPQAEPTKKKSRPPNASRSSGEGVWGRGASLREAASPPESPHRTSLREGARGRGLLYREAPSLASFHALFPHTILRLGLRRARRKTIGSPFSSYLRSAASARGQTRY